MTRPEIRQLECFVAAADPPQLFPRRASAPFVPTAAEPAHPGAGRDAARAALRPQYARPSRSPNLAPFTSRTPAPSCPVSTRPAKRCGAPGAARSRGWRLAFVGALLDDKLMRLMRVFRTRHSACQVHFSDLPPRGATRGHRRWRARRRLYRRAAPAARAGRRLRRVEAGAAAARAAGRSPAHARAAAALARSAGPRLGHGVAERSAGVSPAVRRAGRAARAAPPASSRNPIACRPY